MLRNTVVFFAGSTAFVQYAVFYHGTSDVYDFDVQIYHRLTKSY